MTLLSWSYVAMLVFCLVGTIPLELFFGLGVLRQVRRLALTIVLAAGPFLLWDLWATEAGHWSFDPEQTLSWRVAGVPLEEVGFFVVIPLAAILTYEAVGALRGRAASAGVDGADNAKSAHNADGADNAKSADNADSADSAQSAKGRRPARPAARSQQRGAP